MQILSVLALTAAVTSSVSAGPSGLHAFIHADVHTYQGENCSPRSHRTSADSNSKPWKLYNIKPGNCHNLKKIEVGSYTTEAVAHVKEAETKGCQVTFYRDSTCKQFLRASEDIAGKMSGCQSMDVAVGSMKLVCGQNLKASEESAEDEEDDEDDDTSDDKKDE